jgi:hypothetical protein
MKISISDCEGKENEFLVEQFNKYSTNQYVLQFGEYELFFVPKSKEHQKFFIDDLLKKSISSNEPDMKIELKKGKKSFLKGVYEVSEMFTSKDNLQGIELHVVDGVKQWRIYLTPEKEESLEKMLNKIFT